MGLWYTNERNRILFWDSKKGKRKSRKSNNAEKFSTWGEIWTSTFTRLKEPQRGWTLWIIFFKAINFFFENIHIIYKLLAILTRTKKQNHKWKKSLYEGDNRNTKNPDTTINIHIYVYTNKLGNLENNLEYMDKFPKQSWGRIKLEASHLLISTIIAKL